MNKYLTPIANRMDKQVHLSAIKKAMVAMTPLLIIGSFCLIPEAIPNMIGAENPVSQWITANLDIIYIPFNVGMSLMSLYVTAIIAYHLANSYKLDVPGCMSMGIIAFLMMAVEYTEDGGISGTYLGTKGLFVSRSFEMIPISVIVIGFFLIIRVVCVNVFETIPPMIFTNLLAPLVGSMDNPLAFTFLQMMSCLLFFFGIHPSVLSPITSPISTQFLADNIANYKAHLPLEHFYTGGAISAFANFTGTGVTFGLVFWCIFSKAAAQKKIGRVALIPALFGINEPILFGAPIVLNPLFFIPYVIGGAILGTFPHWLMDMGLLNMPVFNPPYVGVFLEGYLVNLDWRTIVVNAIQMLGSIALWYPFFKLYEKRELENEKAVEAQKSAISAEDEALLNDLDLDF